MEIDFTKLIDLGTPAVIALALMKLLFNDMKHIDKNMNEMNSSLKRIADFLDEEHPKRK